MLGRGLPEHRIASVKSAPGRRLLRVVSIVRTRKFADPNIGPSNPQIGADPPTEWLCQVVIGSHFQRDYAITLVALMIGRHDNRQVGAGSYLAQRPEAIIASQWQD